MILKQGTAGKEFCVHFAFISFKVRPLSLMEIEILCCYDPCFKTVVLSICNIYFLLALQILQVTPGIPSTSSTAGTAGTPGTLVIQGASGTPATPGTL